MVQSNDYTDTNQLSQRPFCIDDELINERRKNQVNFPVNRPLTEEKKNVAEQVNSTHSTPLPLLKELQIKLSGANAKIKLAKQHFSQLKQMVERASKGAANTRSKIKTMAAHRILLLKKQLRDQKVN